MRSGSAAGSQPGRGGAAPGDPGDGVRHDLVAPGARLVAAVLGAWLLFTVGVLAVLPGHALELGLIGVAAYLVATRLAWAPLPSRELALVVAVFAMPLAGSWPARLWASFLGIQEPWVAAALNPAAAAVVVAWLVARRHRPRRRLPALLGWAVGMTLAGALLGAAASGHVWASLADAWIGIAAPIGAAVLVARGVGATAGGWRLLTVAVLAAGVPVLVGLAAYGLTFGVPTSPGALAAARDDLFRPLLVQDLTLGNVNNLASFCVLVLPAAAVATARPGAPRLLRAATGIVLAATALLLVVLVSRLALATAVAALAVLAVVLAGRLPGGRASRSTLAGGAMLLGAALVPYLHGLTAAPARAAEHPPAAVVQPVAAEDSGDVRRRAIEHGLGVAADHLPLGVGPGQYPRYAGDETAAHSLPVTVLAETGVLGLAGLLALAAFVARGAAVALAAARAGPRRDDTMLLAAAVVGSGAYLVLGLVAGVPSSLGQVNAWAMLLWLQVGLVAVGVERCRAR